METFGYLEAPLADELFECIEGPFQAYVTLPSGERFLYHTYSNTLPGSFEDPDTKTALCRAFEEYLRRLRASVLGDQKPRLYWRFRKGNHIQVEDCKGDHRSLVKLYTRLVVPESRLSLCQTCLRTEGEPHAYSCPAAVVGAVA